MWVAVRLMFVFTSFASRIRELTKGLREPFHFKGTGALDWTNEIDFSKGFDVARHADCVSFRATPRAELFIE